MILFPKQYLGLHRALPKEPNDGASQCGLESVTLLSGVAGSLPLGLSLLFRWRSPLPYATATKVAAYSLGVLGSACIVDRVIEEDVESKFLRSQGIEVPRRKLVSRIGYLSDRDNQVLLGGLTGILIASRLRRPWYSSGWKRWFGAFSFGSTISLLTFQSAFALSTSDNGIRARIQAYEEFTKARRDGRSLIKEALTGVHQKQTMPMLPDETFRALKPFGSPSASRGAGSSGSRQSSSGAVKSNDPNNPDGIIRTGPHLGQELPGEGEPIPIANTNYVWKSDNPVQELEQHLTMLKQRRERLALEAEMIWAWLSEKELDFYNSPEGEEKDAKARYLETLGSVHTKTWLEASSCDWMIADSKKRIEQLRSAETNDGKVTWRVGCSDLAAKKSPDHALKILRLNAQGIKQQQEQLEQIKASMAMNMVDPDFDSREETQVYDPTQGKMISEKEMMLRAKDQVETLLKDAKAYQETVEQVIADGEKESK